MKGKNRQRTVHTRFKAWMDPVWTNQHKARTKLRNDSLYTDNEQNSESKSTTF